MQNVISQSFGLDLVNINVYVKVYQTIPLSSRDRAFFILSEFGARQPRPMINVLSKSLGLDVVNINACAKFIKYSKQFRVIDIFHEQSGDKIFAICPVTIYK